MARVLVSGGAGFVGANLIRRLLAEGNEVHLLVRPGQRLWRLEGVLDEAVPHNVALQDRDEIARCVRELAPQMVFHLAAHGGYATQTDVERIFQSDVMGTVNLLDAAVHAEVEVFVNAGSSSEYGSKDHAPTELETVEPDSAYAVAKAAASSYCRFVARRHAMKVTTLRLYSVYGPWEEPTRLFPRLIVGGLRGALPELVSPETVRDFVYVDDAVEALFLAAARRDDEPGAIFNIGSEKQTSLAELVELARTALHIADEPTWGTMAARAWDTSVWLSNCEKAHRVLGWVPKFTLESGFAAFSAWLTEDEDRLAIYREHAPTPAERVPRG